MPLQILLPTDFSQNSRVAIDFIIHQAKHLDAKLILFHAVHVPGAYSMRMDDEIKESLRNEGLANLKQLENELRQSHQDLPDLVSVCVYNSPIIAIEEYVKNYRIDLVGIGTTGHTGSKKSIIGSNALEIVENTKVPVLLVPQSAPIKKIEHIAYASDLDNMAGELDKLVNLAKNLDSFLHILHIFSDDKMKRDITEENTIQEQLRINYYEKLYFEGVENRDVVKGIKDYIAKSDVDLLVMYSKERGLFAQMFKRSFTNEMAMESNVPMMAYKKEV